MRQCGTHIPAQTQTRARAHAPEYVHANARRRNHAPAHKHNHSHYYSMDSLRNRITTRTHAGAELQHGSGALLAPKHIRRELRRVLAQMCVSQPVPAQMSAPERVRYVGAALRRKCAMPLRGLAVSGNQRA